VAETTDAAGGAPAKKKQGANRPPASVKGRMKGVPIYHPSKHDWDALRLEFCSDPTSSLVSISKKHGVNYGTLQRHADEEGWVPKRIEALAQASREVQARAVVQLADGFRVNALDGFAQISRLRKKALELYEQQLDPAAALPVTSDSVVQVKRDTATGTLVRTTAKRVRPLLDAHLIEVLARIEVQWAAMLFGFGKPGRGDEERTVTIE